MESEKTKSKIKLCRNESARVHNPIEGSSHDNDLSRAITTQPLGLISSHGDSLIVTDIAENDNLNALKINGLSSKTPETEEISFSETLTCSFQPEIETKEVAPPTSSVCKMNVPHDGLIYRSFSNPDMRVTSYSIPQYIEPTEEEEEHKQGDDIAVAAAITECASTTTTPISQEYVIIGELDKTMDHAPSDTESVESVDSTAPLTEHSGGSSPVCNSNASPARSTPRAENSLSFENVVSLVRTFPAIINKFLKKPWYASRPDEVCQFPLDLISQYKITPTDIDNTKLLIVSWGESENKGDEYYHLVYAPFGFTSELSVQERPYSLFRAFNKKDLVDTLHLCDEKCYLLDLLDATKPETRSDIEKVVLQIRLNPQYHLIHIAIATERLDFFSDASIKTLNETGETFDKQLRCLCHTENCYPVHLAIAMNRISIVERLLEIDPSLFLETDNAGNNVWHHVSSSNCAQSIYDKCPESHRFIDGLNVFGQSPLNGAVGSGKPLVAAFLITKGAAYGSGERNLLFVAMTSKNAQGVVDVLLQDKPEIVHERDALGNSAIHVAVYKESLNALLSRKVDLNLDINVKNNANETALLLFITSKKPDLLPLLVTLYAHGADMNATDSHGNTALHKAAALVDSKKINVECVKFLIAAGADPNKLNHRNESPRHLAASLPNGSQEVLDVLKAAGARRCRRGYKGCRSNCRNDIDSLTPEEEYEQVLKGITVGIENDYEKTELTVSEKLNIKNLTESSKKSSKPRVNLISFDGGGIRGLVIIQTLIAIEECLGDSIFKYFDWSAGTSTGSLIMAGLAKGKSLRQMQQTYLLLKDRVFDGIIPPYDTVQLERFIQDEFGTDPVWGIPYPRLMISAVNSEKLPVKLEMARNYKPSDKSVNETSKEMPLWMALRRSTAAPVLFKPSEDRYIDGGIISNNPALDLISEVHTYNKQLQLAGKKDKTVQMNCIVSFGTGQIPCTPIDTLSIDSNSPLQSIKTIKNLAAMFIDQATASEGAPVARSRQWADSLEVPFFRFSAPLSKNIFLSSTSDLDVCTMMWDSFLYCRKHVDYISELARVLKHDADHPLQNSPYFEI